MSRYEGMDELLDGVRDRAAKKDGGSARAGDAAPAGQHPYASEPYESIVTGLDDLLQAASRLKSMIIEEDSRILTNGRRDHLLRLLGQVLEELWNAEATLQGVK